MSVFDKIPDFTLITDATPSNSMTDSPHSSSIIDSPQLGSLLDEESSIADPSIRLAEEDGVATEITYCLIENGTKHRGVKLVDSEGYAYNVKRKRVSATDWQCTVRPKLQPCRATVIERSDGTFQPGKKGHNHPAEVGAATAAKISSNVKEKALADLFKPASAVVNEVNNVIITLNIYICIQYNPS